MFTICIRCFEEAFCVPEFDNEHVEVWVIDVWFISVGRVGTGWCHGVESWRVLLKVV